MEFVSFRHKLKKNLKNSVHVRLQSPSLTLMSSEIDATFYDIS